MKRPLWWRVGSMLLLALYAALIVALLSGWPDNDGEKRIPDPMPALYCGARGCEEIGS